MGLAAKWGLLHTRPGPNDQSLRKARVCYNHLAVDLGVQLYDSLVSQSALSEHEDEVRLTNHGAKLVENFGIDLSQLKKKTALQNLLGMELSSLTTCWIT